MICFTTRASSFRHVFGALVLWEFGVILEWGMGLLGRCRHVSGSMLSRQFRKLVIEDPLLVSGLLTHPLRVNEVIQ